MTLKTMYTLKTGTPVDDVDPELPYQFAAEHTVDDKTNRYIVDIVMPIGGSESALFRYPKEGEKVLVAIEDDGNYLMGYLPAKKEKDNIFTGEDDKQILPEHMAGQFFRYKGPNDNTEDKNTYSEIGFYNEQTKWKKMDAQEGEPPPSIDTLKISSTGDIHQESANYSKIKANRFELLSNCDGDFGNHSGDNTVLKKGDVSIRGKNDIVIKAGNSITLRAGRSSIVINDAGISLRSRKVNSNINNKWDSNLKIDPHNGIIITGQRLLANLGTGFTLKDKHGGSIASELGVNRINGFDIRLRKMTLKEYSMNEIFGLVEVLENLATMSIGLADEYSDGISSTAVTVLNVIDDIFSYAGMGCARAILPGVFNVSQVGEYNRKDAGGIMLRLLELIKLILTIIRLVIDLLLPDKVKREYPWIYDALYPIFALVEYGYIFLTAGILIILDWGKWNDEGVIALRDDYIKLDSAKVDIYATTYKQLATVIAGKDYTSWGKEDIVKGIILGVGGLLGGGALAATYFSAIKPMNDKLSEELKSL